MIPSSVNIWVEKKWRNKWQRGTGSENRNYLQDSQLRNRNFSKFSKLFPSVADPDILTGSGKERPDPTLITNVHTRSIWNLKKIVHVRLFRLGSGSGRWKINSDSNQETKIKNVPDPKRVVIQQIRILVYEKKVFLKASICAVERYSVTRFSSSIFSSHLVFLHMKKWICQCAMISAIFGDSCLN